MSRSHTSAIVSFINGIGIPCRPQALQEGTFLPGIDIQQGTILYDIDKMKHPGDLLHEAGHVAVLPPHYRSIAQSPHDLFGEMDPAAAEMAAIAWSWAALTYLQLHPHIVFHQDGYKGGSGAIIENFSRGAFFGVPMLHYLGMTTDPLHGKTHGTFPAMQHWLRPETLPADPI